MADSVDSTSTEGAQASFEWEEGSLPHTAAGAGMPDADEPRTHWLTWVSRSILVVAIAVLAVGTYRLWRGDAAVIDRQFALEGSFRQRLDLVGSGVSVEELAKPADEPLVETTEPVSSDEDGDDPRMAMPVSIYTPAELAALTAEESEVSGIFRVRAPSKGDPIGRISIPAIDLEWMVIEGVDVEYLASGPGHMAWTPVPGQPGNAVISGHRTTYGAPFHDLDLLEVGDRIEVETLTGTHLYRVYDSVVVPPDGVWVVHQWGGAWLTLTTCNPKGSAAERLVVFAELVDGPNREAIVSSTERIPPEEP